MKKFIMVSIVASTLTFPVTTFAQAGGGNTSVSVSALVGTNNHKAEVKVNGDVGLNLDNLITENNKVDATVKTSIDGEETLGNSSENKGDNNKEETKVTSEQSVNSKVKVKAGLVPGDKLYFVDQLLEKIRLALTFDDDKKAELFASISGERIAEANALLEEGKQEKAEALLQSALENQKEYLSLKANSGTEVNIDAEVKQNILALSDAISKIPNDKAKIKISENIDKTFEQLNDKVDQLSDIGEKTKATIKSEINELKESIVKKTKVKVNMDGKVSVKTIN